MVKQCYLFITLLVIVHSLNYGTILIQNDGRGQIQSKEILFSKPFQHIPQVAIALLNGHGDIFAEIHEVNQEGFTLQMMASEEIEAEYAYLAIENDENYQIECFNRIAVGNEIQIPLIIQKPTFIGVLATNTHANNFNIDLLDGNLIVNNDGQLNMCIIITNDEQPIDLIGYQNYQEQETAEFHPFKKQNAMSLVQAQQSLEITHLDQHNSFEIWHHQSIELVKDSSIEVYPTHRSLEIVSEDQPNQQSQFKQEESLEIFKLDNKDQQSISDQKLIVEDIHLDNLNDNPQSNNNQIENIKLDDESMVTQQQTTVAVSNQSEDIKLDLESTQENEQSETITFDDQQQQVEQSQQQQKLEDVKLEPENTINNQDSQQINLTNEEDVQILQPEKDTIINSQEQQNTTIIQQTDKVQIDQSNQDGNVQNLQSDVTTNNNDQVLQQEDVIFDNQDTLKEESKQEIQIEDIKLDNTDISSINVNDIPQQQQAKEIKNDQLSVQSDVKPIEQTTITEDVVIHADEVKIENVKISESNLDDISTEQQVQENNTEQKIQEDNNDQVQEAIQENKQIIGQSDDVSVDPDAFSEPQQRVTQIKNDDDLQKQESDIDDMIKVAQELKEEAQQLKNKNRSEQQQEKLDKEVSQLEDEIQVPKVVEDQISLDVNSAYEDQKEIQIEQPKEEQQPPIIYLNDSGVNPEQQLITQEIKDDDKLMITQNQLQEEVDKELQTQEQQVDKQVESTSQIGEEDIQIVDASIKLDEDHQEMEIFESGQVELIPDQVQHQVDEVQQIEQSQVDVEPQEDYVQEQETKKEEGAIEIGLTKDEGEAFIRKSKKSDFLREKQNLKDKLSNVVRDFNLDSVQDNSLDSVVEDDKQYSLIIDRLDVPENNEQVIVLKDEDYEQNENEPESKQEVKQLGDYLEAVDQNIENVNFIYDDEQKQEQQTVQIEDVKLNDDINTDEETNYQVVEAKDDELVDTTLESIDDQQQYQLLSSDVAVSVEDTSTSNVENQIEDEIISFDEFQKELEVLANTIGNIKQENIENQQSSDFIIVNDNSQIYEVPYDVQSNELPLEDEPQIQEDQKEYYQGFEDDQNTQIEQQTNQEQQQTQEVEQTFDIPEQDVEDQSFQNEQEQLEDQTQQVESYDDAEPQDQYLTIDNLVKDNSSLGQSYEQAPQYYDESNNEQPEQYTQDQVESTLESDYDISEQQQQQNQEIQEQYQNDQQEQDFIVMKADQFMPQFQDESQQQEQLSDNQKEQDIYSETPKDENEIDIIVDVGNLQNDQPQLNEQDYDFGDNFEKQQTTQNQVQESSQKQQPQQQQEQPQQQLQSGSISNKKHKQKIQHSITISHNPQQGNLKQADRSIEIQHEDQSLKIEHQVSQEELKKDLKEQLKQELKEELKQEIKQEIQESHNRRKSSSLVIEDNVNKDPERPAQKAINNFNNLLNDVVGETLKEEDRKHYQKLPIVDVKRDTFNKVEPKIEQGIEDLKKALGLKGGVEVVDNNGKKQVINVDDLKKESEKFQTRPERDNKKDSPQYEEYLKKVTEKSQKNNNDELNNYQEQHNIRKQEILENIKRELEIKKGHFTLPNDSPQELSPYEFERVYMDWEKNKQDIIPSMLQHSIEQPSIQDINSNSDQVKKSSSLNIQRSDLNIQKNDYQINNFQENISTPNIQQKSTERISRKEEVDKEVQELLYGNQKNKKQQQLKQSQKEFKVEDLKYTKDDPLLDSTYSGFVQVKANLRKRSH
ncbi:unnamed protein product [Paramecium primaurelia]|uniref:Uncharacterized protein n=1 Tax=Paramecium primaurelia TaxID=5886 RepID=A0A8S1L106_PARPR|nr:unnamed protein product [Paramecium primaurelia]